MIFITGDTHIPIDIHKLSSKAFKEQKLLSKSDYLIICGDFGGVWDCSNQEKYWIKWFTKKNFTTLFIDGNHENFDLLNNNYNVVDFQGGKAHKICDSIYHLMRGEIYNIDSKRIFVMGGASSHDKEYRTQGKNWWKEELPNEWEYQNAKQNLQRHNWQVDYVVTHCAPTDIQAIITQKYPQDCLTNFLSEIKTNLNYNHWFFGHYHQDIEIDNNHTCLFEKIIKI